MVSEGESDILRVAGTLNSLGLPPEGFNLAATIYKGWVLIDGGVHLLVAAKEHLGMKSSVCVICGQGVIDALSISITLRDQKLIQGVVSHELVIKDRGEIGRQMVDPLAKEA